MGIFSKLFGKKAEADQPQPEPELKAEEPKGVKINLPVGTDLGFKNMSIGSKDRSRCVGIDQEILDFLYFKSDKDKQDFIALVNEIIDKQNLKESIGVVEFNSRVCNWDIVKGLDSFLYRVLLDVETTSITATTVDGVEHLKQKPSTKYEFSDKVRGDYDPPRFYKAVAFHNAKQGCKDLAKIVQKALDSFESLPDYKDVNTYDLYFNLGKIYLENGEVEIAKSYFDSIHKRIVNDQLKGQAKNCKTIGSLFEQTDKRYALTWYKLAMSINPNIGLKAKIVALEKIA